MYGPIGLCCISLRSPGLIVTEEQICGLFSEMAAVSKVLIFQREPSLKSFIEFSDSKSLEQALRSVGNLSQEYGKVSLYHSKKESLRNAVEFASGKQLQGVGPSDARSSATVTDGNASGELISHPNPTDTLAPWQQPPGSIPSGLTPSNPSTFPGIASCSHDEHVRDSPSDVKNLFREEEILPRERPYLVLQDSSPTQTDDHGGIVLCVERYYLPPKHVTLLQNLAGCFGNLQALVANHVNHRFFLEMENAHQASLVAIYLQDLVFFGSPLNVRRTRIAALVDPSFNSSDIIFFKVDPQQHRFKRHLSIKFNPPSGFLHFTSLCPELTPLILYELIAQVHEPQYIYKLLRHSRHSNMYLVQFGTAEESIHVLAALHNKIINNKSMKISFSHPEIL